MMKIFAGRHLGKYLDEQRDSIRDYVWKEDRNEFLSYNEADYIDKLVSKFRIDPLVFHWDKATADFREEKIPAERFPVDFDGISGKKYLTPVFVYEIPVTGSKALLSLKPSSNAWTTEIGVKENHINIEIINWRDDEEEVKKKAQGTINNIQIRANAVDKLVRKFNENLEQVALQIVEDRKRFIKKQLNLLKVLEVPIKKVKEVPEAFSVPIKKKKPIIEKSKKDMGLIAEEYVLNVKIYNDILRICFDMGREIERHPGIYDGKGEEILRDLFILVLSPHFQSVTGETFNKTGKTDILIRHEGANVFVAECKFWRGIKKFHKAIDQALGYLTWRDSKAAILCFIENKKIEPVLKTIEGNANKHRCFVKDEGKKGKGWYAYKFHLLEDSSKGIDLAVICFHFPKE